MNWKKTLVRTILFAVLFVAAGLLCTGCCIESVINDLGSTRTGFYDYHYEMSPDRGEIVFTSKRSKQYNYLPFYGAFHHKPAWTSVTDREERIPLDPLPDNLTRCGLTVETVPDAPRAKKLIPAVPQPDIIIGGEGRDNLETSSAEGLVEFEARVDKLPVSGDETILLSAHPDDLPYLSQPFRLRLFLRDGSPEEYANGEPYLMFPVAVDGGRYELLTVSGTKKDDYGSRIHNLYPFREAQDMEIRQEYRGKNQGLGKPTTEAICWKVLWMPSAIVADTLALPGYIVFTIFAGVIFSGY